MARPSKSATLDLSKAIELTAGVIERLKCPPDKEQDFLRDSKAPGLKVRVTGSGAKSFVFEAKLKRKNIRRTIGDVRAWTIDAARVEANRLRVLFDQGQDPGELERQAAADAAARVAKAAADAITVGEVWPRYVELGSPKRKDAWKPRYVADMAKMVTPGGVPKKRGKGVTLPGHLFPLMALPIGGVNEDVLAEWFEVESRRSKVQATRALMVFRGFLRWCSTRKEYRHLADREAGKAPAIIEALPTVIRRRDVLAAAQVAGWWSGVMQLPNVVASAYLRTLLLTGARRESISELRWDDVDLRWRMLTIANKVEAQPRTIPLTDYLAWTLSSLPRPVDAEGRPSPFVFASNSKSGHLTDPRSSHERVMQIAGIKGLTIHGLRRSFATLAEAAGAPDGAVKQIEGRAVDVAGGYRIRSVDDLRPILAQIERHILGLAGEQFDPASVEALGLRVVAEAA